MYRFITRFSYIKNINNNLHFVCYKHHHRLLASNFYSTKTVNSNNNDGESFKSKTFLAGKETRESAEKLKTSDQTLTIEQKVKQQQTSSIGVIIGVTIAIGSLIYGISKD